MAARGRWLPRAASWLAITLASVSAGCTGQSPGTAVAPKVVLIIGDGLDDQQITIARNYLVGYDGRLVLDGMPFRGAVQVQTIAEDNPAMPVYVGDSANTATAMATGVLTSIGRIATTARTDTDLTTIMELAAAAGMGTGLVTTSSVTDATPAAFVAHVSSRLCQGPRGMTPRRRNRGCPSDLKANGGKGSIAEQMADSSLAVLLGGGARYFDQPIEDGTGETVRERAVARGFRVIDRFEDLAGLPPEARFMGLFAPEHLAVKLRGTGDAAAELVGRAEDGRVELPEPFGCEPNPDFAGTPRLASMTEAALERLDRDASFMLMVESASIDKQSHMRRPCGQIGEVEQLDETLAVVLDYARAHPETLVLVTADHGHAAKLVPERSAFLALNYASPGYFARIRTPEGAVMGVNYATNDSPVQEEHSGVQVPLFAAGPDAEELPTLIRQSDLFGIAKRHLGL